MKYIKYLIFIIICLVPTSVLAYGVQFSCPKSIKSNETFNCTVYSPSFCSEISMELVLPEGFSLKNEIVGENFKSTREGNSLSYVAVGNIDRVLTTLQITAPNTSSSNNLSITLKNVKYKYQEKDNEYSITTDLTESINYVGSTTTTIKDTENLILTLSTGLEGENQTLSCTPANGSCDVLLSNANIPTKTGYTFTGWGTEENCTKGETEKYTLKTNTTLYACFESSMIGHLKKLTVEDYQLGFNTNVYNYTINVDSNLTNLKIDAESVNPDAKIEINNPILNNETNTVTITVTEDDTILTYTIIVKKEGLVKPLLSSLLIRDYPINFDSNTFNYDLTISKKTKVLDIAPVANMEGAKVEIIGNENLSDGSIISIVVVAETSASSVYTINILNKNILEIYKYYFIAGAIIVFMFTVYFIVRHIKKKNGEYPLSNGEYVKSINEEKEKKVKEKKPKKEKIKKSKKEKENKKDVKPDSNFQEETIETLDL